ncbi:MAG: tRNA (adenosine(37)-N6)-dimethylallyltransferase MiaA [Candidatus Omnitrophica bacterium]|nr:tRNA (adenosine(37)-N6)-dimethylallyltransferase MiaA [Candidatus Omnitrophota bacterium]
MSSVIFIVGPTATGKTDLSLSLAKHIGGEIISCDSMLIYKEPRIITSKPTATMLRDVRHHFVDIVSVTQAYNVFDYYSSATKKIEDLHAKNVPVIVCGGSGLYAKALLDGIFQGAGKDEELRQNLQDRANECGIESLYQELVEVDCESAEKIAHNDLRRIIRALEVYHTDGVPFSQKKKEVDGLFGKLPIKIFALKLDRNKLYERINQRVDEMFESGAVNEVKELLKVPLSITAAKIIGIKEITACIDEESDINCAKAEIAKNTRNFAKRQITWFKKDQRIQWIEADNLTIEQAKNEIIRHCASTERG